MSTEVCSCASTTLGNMGAPGCLSLASILSRIIIVPLLDSDGVQTAIDLTDTLNAAYFSDHMQEYTAADALVNKANRWYITPFLENVNNARGETTFFETSSGRKIKIKNGIRAFTGFIVDEDGATFEMLKNLKKFGCSKFGMFGIDTQGNLIGNRSKDGFLKCIAIDKNSWDPQYIWATDTEPGMCQVQFDFGKLENDHDLGMILASDLSANDVFLLELEGLLDMYISWTSAGQTSAVVKFYSKHGSVINNTPISGLVAADLALYNVTGSAAVTISTMTESSTVPGTYTLTYASQTLTNVLRITPNKTGFDGSAVVTNTKAVA